MFNEAWPLPLPYSASDNGWVEALNFVAQHGHADFGGSLRTDAASGALFPFPMAQSCARLVPTLTKWMPTNALGKSRQSQYVPLALGLGVRSGPP